VEIADANGVPVPPGAAGGQWTFADFADFLRQWLLSQACLVRLEDFRRISEEFIADEAAQGVRYTEVHLSLPEHGVRLGDWEGPLEAVLDGLASGERSYGVRWGVVVDVVRGIGARPSWKAARIAIRYAGRGVVAVGLGGPSSGPEDYADVFATARRAGLHSVPHAGESAGPTSIREAIDALGAERIGHGISVVDDPALMEEVRERGIVFDVCPTSNVRTGIVGSIDEHPFPVMLDAGLLVTLNSDDPTMFGSPVAGEYRAARESFALSDDRLASIARTGARASFAPDDVVHALEAGVDAWLASR
jgi:adenosine deaminase